jgi:hypothetical protein
MGSFNSVAAASTATEQGERVYGACSGGSPARAALCAAPATDCLLPPSPLVAPAAGPIATPVAAVEHFYTQWHPTRTAAAAPGSHIPVLSTPPHPHPFDPQNPPPAAAAAARAPTGNIVQILRARGLIQEVTSDDLEALATRSSVSVYCGFDPTADSLHLGNLLGIIVLSWFQR